MVKAVITGEKRKGGRLVLVGCVTLGLAIGGLLAYNAVEIVSAFARLTNEETLIVNESNSRVALVVTAAGLIGLIGLMLDVLYTGDKPGYDLTVRAIALTAGATAFAGGFFALPAPMLGAVTFWTFVVVALATAALLLTLGLIQFVRSANRKPAPAPE